MSATAAVPFAFESKEKKVRIDPKDAEKSTSYYCPECDGEVRKRNPENRRTHFFHLNRPDYCAFSSKSESEEHYMAKTQIQELFENKGSLEVEMDCTKSYGYNCQDSFKCEFIYKDHEIVTEYHWRGFYIDVAILSRDKEPLFFIEVVHEHPIEDKKLEALNESRVPYIECIADKEPFLVERSSYPTLCPERLHKEAINNKRKEENANKLREVWKVFCNHRRQNFDLIDWQPQAIQCEEKGCTESISPLPDLSKLKIDEIDLRTISLRTKVQKGYEKHHYAMEVKGGVWHEHYHHYDYSSPLPVTICFTSPLSQANYKQDYFGRSERYSSHHLSLIVSGEQVLKNEAYWEAECVGDTPRFWCDGHYEAGG